MNEKYYIYIIRCSDTSLYTGITTDMKRRYSEHFSKKGAKYTKSHTPVKIEALWEVSSGRSLASRLEYKLKKLTKTEKEKLILNQDKVKEIIDDPGITVSKLMF